MCDGARVGFRGGEHFAWAAFGGQGGWAWGIGGACGGRVWVTGRAGCALGWCSSRWVCVGCLVWGAVRLVGREGLWRACAGDRAGGEAGVVRPGAARDDWRVWATVWGVEREGQGMWGWVRLRCVGVRVCLQRPACVVSCWPGDLKQKLGAFRGRGKAFADECAYLVHLLVGCGRRVL